jgi:hypothetical protein
MGCTDTLDFTVTLGYIAISKSKPSQPIVFHLFGPKAAGTLSEKVAYWGLYQIFTSPKNSSEHRGLLIPRAK